MLRRDPFERVLRSDPMDNWATITLIVLAGVLSTLDMQGRGFPALTWEDSVAARPWLLWSSCLLHGGYLHLVMNLYWTWQFGRVLEPSIGTENLVWITLVFAGGSSGYSYVFEGPSVGLSGVGFAYFGFLWALSRFHPRGRALLDQRTTSFFVAWFFLCIVMTYTEVFPVANVAHGAGAVIGAVAGWGVARGATAFAWQRWIFVLVAAVGVLLAMQDGA